MSAGIASMAIAAHGVPAQAGIGDLDLVSRVGLSGPGADDRSHEPTISGDGNFVAFETLADNIAAPGSNEHIVVKDMTSGTLELASRASGVGGSPFTNATSYHHGLASSGRFVCFITGDPAAGPPAGVSAPYVVVRELGGSQAITFIGHALPAFMVALGAADLDPYGHDCDVSDDGRYVSYSTDAPLVAEDTNTGTDIYRTDVWTGSHTLVSRADGPGGNPADDYAVVPDMTPDGRFVAFRSRADNLSPDDDNALSNVFLRDVASGTTTWISRADGPAGGPGTRGLMTDAHGSTDASVSDDGRRVAFVSTQLGLDSTTTTSPGSYQVAVRDTVAGTTRIVSRSTAPNGSPTVSNGYSDDPRISGDGRFVVFTSAATQLDPESVDTNGQHDIFVHDLSTRRTSLVSRAAGLFGAPSNGFSHYPAISRDGRFVAFGSEATNLVPGSGVDNPATPGNEAFNIYRRELDPARPLPADLPGAPAITLGRLSTSADRGGAARRRNAFVLSEYARVTAVLRRGVAGRRLRGRCRPATRALLLRHARRCRRYVRRVARRRLVGFEGSNRLRVATLVRRRRLAAGHYRLTLRATDFARLRSRRVHRDFVVRR